MMRDPDSGKRGFSLVELLIVIAVIGILAGTLLLAVPPFIVRARMTKTQSTIDTISLVLEHYNSEQRGYPPAYDLVADLMKNDRKGKPYYEFTADVLGGPGVRYESVRIMDPASGALSILPIPPGEFVLDAFNRPIYYIPSNQYSDTTLQFQSWEDKNSNGLADANETFYYPTSYQMWSAGPDGIVRGILYGGRLIPAVMPFDDNRDNDGDGLFDFAEDTGKATDSKPIGQNLPEDDIMRGI